MDYTYPASYEASRSRFIHGLDLLRPIWPNLTLTTHPLKADPSASVDYAWAHATHKKNLVIISTCFEFGTFGAANEKLKKKDPGRIQQVIHALRKSLARKSRRRLQAGHERDFQRPQVNFMR